MKHHMLKLLVVALCATPLFAAPAAGEPESSAAAVEAEIREELTSLRVRLLKLEAMLDSLQEQEAAPAVAAAVEPAAASPGTATAEATAPASAEPLVADLGNRKATWTPPKAVSDAEPSQETPVGVASSGGQAISFTGLLDTYLSYNTNSPENGYNDLYYTNPNSRGFGLNQAKLEIDASGDGPIGFRTDIWFGSGAR
ncbi:MAG: outer membrane beta-barrel protein, partial [Bryobacterales bacterium]|nr:outer membrane beta-barrel protein [Bryobacterales bacterium]